MTDPVALVDNYLRLCEDRQLDQASRLLAPGARIVFPGDRVFAGLTEMAAAATGQYRWVRKHRDRYFVGEAGDHTSVTSLGTLYGEGNDGVAFDGIRYADVFLIRDGLIVEQNVYNDLATVRPGVRTA